jgi:TetR/AcrR family transcriptional regulator
MCGNLSISQNIMDPFVSTSAGKTTQKVEDQRRKGRPKKDAAAAGRELFVEAARVLLLTQHPKELTQVSVARAANADPRLLRYYFGTLDQLLTEVAIQFVRDLDRRMAEASNVAGTAEEKLSLRLRTLLQFYVEAPNFWPLVLEKIYLSNDQAAREIRRDFNNTSFRRLAEIVQNGQKNGEITPIDSRLLYIALIGLAEIFVTGKPIIEILFSEYEQEGLGKDYENFIIEIVMRGLIPR